MDESSEGSVLAEEKWRGIPRNKIPWYPSIDYEKCVGCGRCIDYCKLGVYELDEKNGKQRPVVKNPYNCVVLCSGCDSICPAGAIKHPSNKVSRETIGNLRKAYSFRRRKGEKSE
jgi:NAD-dependent dihydropyrimidine dehydrogenase PreA subunit